MKRLFKITGLTILGFVGLIFVGTLTLQLISNEQYRRWAEQAAESFTGRTLQINGDFDFHVGTQVSLLAEDIRLANARWGTRGDMLTADRLFVELSLLGLLKGLFDIQVELDAPDILLETNQNREANWIFSENEKEPAGKGEAIAEGNDSTLTLPLKPYIRNLEVKDLVFSYNDVGGGNTIEAGIETFHVFFKGSEIPLQLKASYQGVPVVLDGSLGKVHHWHENKPASIDIQGRLNEAAVTIKGQVGPMMPQPAARVKLLLNAESTDTFSPFIGRKFPAFKGFDVQVTATANEGRVGMEDINFTLQDPRLQIKTGGSVEGLIEGTGLDIHTDISVQLSPDEVKQLNIPHLHALPTTMVLQAGIKGNLDALSLSHLECRVKDKGLDLVINGSADNLVDFAGVKLHLDGKAENTTIISRYLGSQIPGFGPLKVSADIGSKEKQSALESLSVTLDDPAVKLDIAGSVEHIGRTASQGFIVSGIDMIGHIESVQLSRVAEKLNISLPGTLPASFVLDTSLSGSLEELSVTSFRARLEDDGLTASLEGKADDVLKKQGIEVELHSSVSSTEKFGEYAGTQIPDLGSITLDGKVFSKDGEVQLAPLELNLTGESLKAQASVAVESLLALAGAGKAGHDFGDSGIDMKLAAETTSIAKLAKVAEIDIPLDGSLHLKGHVASTGEKLALKSLDGNIIGEGFKGVISASTADLVNLSGVHATLNMDLATLELVESVFQKDLSSTGPWSLDLTAASKDIHASSLAVDIDLDGVGIATSIKANIDNIKSPQGFSSTLAVKSDNLQELGVLVNRELSGYGPLDITGKFSGKPGEYRVETFKGILGEGVIDADLAYSSPGEGNNGRALLVGKMSVSDLDLTPLFKVSGEPEDTETENTVQSASETDQQPEDAGTDGGGKLFSSKPFSTGRLQKIDADVRIDSTNVIFSEDFKSNGEIVLTIDRGLLKVDPLKISGGRGGIGDGVLIFDARNPEALLDIFLDLEGYAFPGLGGEFDFDMDVKGRGVSPAELMANLNGRLVVSINNVELEKNLLTFFGSGLLTQLNPLKSDTTTLECAIARLDISDGMVNFKKQLAAQTTQVTWLGGGEINLKTEEIDIAVSSKARDTISSLTTLGLAELVQIGGTLAEPNVGLDSMGVAKKYLEYTAFVATGGLSFLATKVYDNVKANRNQCEQILAGLNEEE